MSKQSRTTGAVLVLMACLGFGLNPIFARLAYDSGIPAESASLFRFLAPGLLLVPALRGMTRQPRLVLMSLAGGIFMGIGTVTYFRALEVLPVATVALIYYTYPAFTVLLGHLAFRNPVTRKEIVAVGIMTTGAAVALSPSGMAEEHRLVAVFCLLAPLAYGTLLNLLGASLAPMPLLPKLSWILFGCVLGSLPLALGGGFPSMPDTASGYFALALLSVCGMLIPACLLTVGASMAGASTAGVVSGVELVVALSAGWLILGETVYWRQVAGGVLVLLAACTIHGRTGQPPAVH